MIWSLGEGLFSFCVVNNNLEQQAKAIYHQIFIASSSPEWTQGTLSDIADITMGQSPSGSSSAKMELEQFSIKDVLNLGIDSQLKDFALLNPNEWRVRMMFL